MKNQIYFNDIETDIASVNTSNEVINLLRRVNVDKLDDDEWQEILSDAAEKCNTSILAILECISTENTEDYTDILTDICYAPI